MMIKKYRGNMAKFIISNNVSNINDLEKFNEDNLSLIHSTKK